MFKPYKLQKMSWWIVSLPRALTLIMFDHPPTHPPTHEYIIVIGNRF